MLCGITQNIIDILWLCGHDSEVALHTAQSCETLNKSPVPVVSIFAAYVRTIQGHTQIRHSLIHRQHHKI